MCHRKDRGDVYRRRHGTEQPGTCVIPISLGRWVTFWAALRSRGSFVDPHRESARASCRAHPVPDVASYPQADSPSPLPPPLLRSF